ncbi:MAG: PIG-L family deacetylase [Dehalococcoidia bacterium]
MGTLVSLHAHPDDEAIITGVTLAKAAARGRRVIVPFAARGEVAVGEVEPDRLAAADPRIGEDEHDGAVAPAHRPARLALRQLRRDLGRREGLDHALGEANVGRPRNGLSLQ